MRIQRKRILKLRTTKRRRDRRLLLRPHGRRHDGVHREMMDIPKPDNTRHAWKQTLHTKRTNNRTPQSKTQGRREPDRRHVQTEKKNGTRNGGRQENTLTQGYMLLNHVRPAKKRRHSRWHKTLDHKNSSRWAMRTRPLTIRENSVRLLLQRII